jgi:hypothetical protein
LATTKPLAYDNHQTTETTALPSSTQTSRNYSGQESSHQVKPNACCSLGASFNDGIDKADKIPTSYD